MLVLFHFGLKKTYFLGSNDALRGRLDNGYCAIKPCSNHPSMGAIASISRFYLPLIVLLSNQRFMACANLPIILPLRSSVNCFVICINAQSEGHTVGKKGYTHVWGEPN